LKKDFIRMFSVSNNVSFCHLKFKRWKETPSVSFKLVIVWAKKASYRFRYMKVFVAIVNKKCKWNSTTISITFSDRVYVLFSQDMHYFVLREDIRRIIAVCLRSKFMRKSIQGQHAFSTCWSVHSFLSNKNMLLKLLIFLHCFVYLSAYRIPSKLQISY
jgi:hypothetical protein